MKSLGIIGFGIMGEALIEGITKKISGLSINVIEKSQARRDFAVQHFKAKDFENDYAAFMKVSDIVILAIKPQDSAAVLETIKPYSKNACIISILAGKTLDFFLAGTQATEIARFMPSLAASVGKSVTGVSFSNASSENFKKDALLIAESIGLAMEIPERLMPAIVGASGSGIAFVFEFIHAMAMGSTRAGLPYASSLKIVLDVLEGAVATLKSNNVHPSDMTSRVCSPAGTTIEGILALEKGAFAATVMNAVGAASDRARELEG